MTSAPSGITTARRAGTQDSQIKIRDTPGGAFSLLEGRAVPPPRGEYGCCQCITFQLLSKVTQASGISGSTSFASFSSDSCHPK